jgi:D-glycero-alpha-D-manno-heptose 1-phosphate guanylyltransferase
LPSVKAAILTGGLGTRLRAVVSDRPKPLAEVKDRPFVVHLLDQLCKFSISQAVLCTGYLGEMVESRLGKSYRNLSLKYSPEPVALGTAGALRLALPLFDTQQVLVLNGDSYCEIDLTKLISFHIEEKAFITIAVTFVADTSRYGTVLLNDRGDIVSFKEKGQKNGPGLINAGIYILDRSVIKVIPVSKHLSLERDVFPQYIGHSLRGFLTEGFFIDIGSPMDYERAQRLLPPISSNSTP